MVTDWTAGVGFPAGARTLSFPQRPNRLWGLPSLLLSNGYRGPFLEIKRPGREAGYSPAFNVEVKNGGDILNSTFLLMAWCLIN
jgi:hypothetical protein